MNNHNACSKVLFDIIFVVCLLLFGATAISIIHSINIQKAIAVQGATTATRIHNPTIS
jgi:hypothetical protein